MKKNVLIIGAGGVGAVVTHKCAQNNDRLGDICIASRTIEKCQHIIDDVKRRNNLKDRNKNLHARQLDASQREKVVAAIRETSSDIVINVGTAFVNDVIMDACLEAGAAYIDTAVAEDIDVINAPYPWYAAHEWKRKADFSSKGLTAILGAGFDPGVVNAYSAYALKHEFDIIREIDILDVNAGDHGKYFATNFDPEINLREILEDVGYWEDRQWKECAHHEKSRFYEFPVVGKQKVYLMGHDEVHSLSINMDVDAVRFWMGFSDHYLNCFRVLENIGLLSHEPVTTAEGQQVIPLKVVKACLPDPSSLAAGYKGKTCIGNLIQGEKDGLDKSLFIYNVCDHQECFREVGSQAISYTAGVPPAAAAMLIADGTWDAHEMVNVEELDPDPFLALLEQMGLPTSVKVEEC
ncbi:MAG TPA: saccharopine dehydrogenase family protein [Gammaproteobacteria bacterium]|nr:saccharopine dehydrogenase family protein [Gammaproteobacteria bacterium]